MGRICPGMFFAMNSIFIGIATMLYVFNISKAKDEHGHEIEPRCDYTPNMVRYASQNMWLVIVLLTSSIVTRYPLKLALHHVRRKR